MRLLNPSPGELLDRLTILELKIDAAEKREMDSAHFEAEKTAIEERMQFWNQCLKTENTSQETWDDVNKNHNGLIAVNSLLWAAEDDVRSTGDNEAFKLARLCKQIAAWNDARAHHIAQLNALYGLQEGNEKIYKKRMAAINPEMGQ